MRLALLLALGLVGCAVSGAPVDSRTEWIVDGELSLDEPAVVMLFNRQEGGLCTGTLIAPRVILTAKHCVQMSGADEPSPPSAFVVGIGNRFDRLTDTLTVTAVHTTPGVYTAGRRGGLDGELVGVDIGLLILTRAVTDVEPIPVRRDRPSDQVGAEQLAVGFGETPSGETGTKYETTTSVTMLAGNVIYTEPMICQGDSGGPLLQLEPRQVIGVTSFGSGSCGAGGIAGYNRVDTFIDIIDDAVRESGECVREGDVEACDGRDNDCNGEVDEGCLALGELCTTSEECVGGAPCDETPDGTRCTMKCDPLRPLMGCPMGLYCAGLGGCDGTCLPGVPGAKEYGEECASHTECLSLTCLDPGDGKRRCLAPCEGDRGMCLAGEVCAAVAGACGGCVAEERVEGLRGLGEACASPEECASANCVDDGTSYCTRACSADEECGAAFHCRGSVCARGPRQGLGGGCAATEDCETGQVCATRGVASFCTQYCLDASACPSGFDCTPSGGGSFCTPSLSLVGEACAAAGECASGLCAMVGGESVCTRNCGAESPCEPGYECDRTADGSAYCVAPDNGDDDGGCGCAVPGRSRREAPLAALTLSLLALVAIRRRRRHR